MRKKKFIIFPVYPTTLGTPPTLEEDSMVLEEEKKLEEE